MASDVRTTYRKEVCEMWLGIALTGTKEITRLETPAAIESDRKGTERMVAKSDTCPG